MLEGKTDEACCWFGRVRDLVGKGEFIMRRTMLSSLLLPVVLAATIVLAQPALSDAQAPKRSGTPSLILLVRHAEKSAEPANDPLLTPAGTERAQALAAALGDAGVTAIITTELRRTRDTAEPLAEKLRLKPEVIAVRSSEVGKHVQAVAAAVRRHAGGVVLVVGHSNTVPKIIAALGGPRLPDICDSVYDNLFVLVPQAGKAHLVRSHYGMATPPGPDCR
jgi:phosphohistidine phosphatase SixA